MKDIHYPGRVSPRGICKVKKDDIVKKLCPLMGVDRREFWIELPTSNVPDLINQA